MKTKLILSALVLSSQLNFAQTDKERLGRTLSFLSTGTSFSSLGNFASISTSDETIKGSVFFLNEQNEMYTITIKAGATQGIGAIFDEGKLNSNVSIGGEYRYILNKNDIFLGVDQVAQDVLNEEMKLHDEVFLKGKLEIFKRVDSIQQLSDEDKIKELLFPDQSKKLKELKPKLERYDALSLTEKDKLSKKVRAYYREMDSIRMALSSQMVISDKSVDNLIINETFFLRENYRKKRAEVKSKINKLLPDLVRMNYLAFGYQATNKVFVRYIDTLEFDKQLSKTDYTSHGLTLSYNWISNVNKSNIGKDGKVIGKGLVNSLRYLSIGANYKYTDNQSTLEQLEVSDIRFNNDENTRTVIKKQNAFVGEYLEDLNEVTAYIDYYAFISPLGNSLALHLNPKMTFRDDVKPVSTMQIGLLLPFKNLDKAGSSLNIEIFYKIKDVFNTTNTANSILNRNIIGIQTALPFNL